MSNQNRETLRAAIESNQLETVASLLAEAPSLRESIDAPLAKWGRPALAAAPSVEMAKLLLSHGATLEAVSHWWSPGFFVARAVDADVGRFLVERGAMVSPHAAAGLGLADRLEAMISTDSQVVVAKGGDGNTPLAFARTVEVAAVLIDHGADLDARDEDHRSTPAQWLIGERPEVARYILDRGATPDIFLAAALGDREMAERLIAKDRTCLSQRVGKAPFPGLGYEGLGGTILQWSLGFNSYAHQYAAKRGHSDLFDFLFTESDVTTRFLVSCVMARRDDAERIASENPGIVEKLPREDLELLARYCWETNVDIEAVRLMLDLGFPLDVPETSHSYLPLHNAAWGGYADLVDLLLERGAPVDTRDPDHHSTPLGHALYCCLEDGRHSEGEYGRVVTSLIRAGCPWEPTIYPTGDEKVDAALEPFLRERVDGVVLLRDDDRVHELLSAGVSEDELAGALLAAAKCGRRDLCELLLDAGAPIRPTGEYGLTPLHVAVIERHFDVLELLLAHGGDVTLRTKFGSNLLHAAGGAGADSAMIDLLMNHGSGVGINDENQFGKTPVDHAVDGGHDETVVLLRSHGGQEAQKPSEDGG